LGSFEFQPDVILSGINAGANVGRSVLHSGTIGAILTGAQLGLSGLAVSVQWGEDVHYDTAAAVAIEVLQELMNAPSRTLLNLNVPNLRPRTEGRASRTDLDRRRGEVGATASIGESLGDEGELTLASRRGDARIRRRQRRGCRRGRRVAGGGLRLAHSAARTPRRRRPWPARHDAFGPRGD
jgi:hypothetical protein